MKKKAAAAKKASGDRHTACRRTPAPRVAELRRFFARPGPHRMPHGKCFASAPGTHFRSSSLPPWRSTPQITASNRNASRMWPSAAAPGRR
jgi:hypothetical protein